MTSSPPKRESMRSFERTELASVDEGALVERFQSWRLLWLAQSKHEAGPEPTRRIMSAIASSSVDVAGEEWSVENSCGDVSGTLDDAKTVIRSLAGEDDEDGGDGQQRNLGRRRRRRPHGEDGTLTTPTLPPRFYCSTVLNGEAATRVLEDAAPLSEPSFLSSRVHHSSPMWLFVGRNCSRRAAMTAASSSHDDEDEDDCNAHDQNRRKKKKKKEGLIPSSTNFTRRAIVSSDTGIKSFISSSDEEAAAAAAAAGAVVNVNDEQEHVAGRTEHTDHVMCSGTWHYQVSGSKVWYLRPLNGAAAWKQSSSANDDDNNAPPPEPDILSCLHPDAGADGGVGGGVGGATVQVVEDEISDDEGEGGRVTRRRLRVEVREGDLLFIDTSAWWHETALPPTSSSSSSSSSSSVYQNLSVSYAREFFLHSEHGGESGARRAAEGADRFTNVTCLYAPRAVKAGEVVVTEEECRDCEAGRSEDPNCELCEVEVEAEVEAEVEEGGGKKKKKKSVMMKTVMALAAVRDIAAGEFITIAPSDDEDDEEEGAYEPCSSDDEDDDDDDDDDEMS